jgi:hypothetical protein
MHLQTRRSAKSERAQEAEEEDLEFFLYIYIYIYMKYGCRGKLQTRWLVDVVFPRNKRI